MATLAITTGGSTSLTPDPWFTIVGLLLSAIWIVALFNAMFTPSVVWEAANQRKWVVIVATLFLGPLLGSALFWFGFRRTLKQRADAGGFNGLQG